VDVRASPRQQHQDAEGSGKENEDEPGVVNDEGGAAESESSDLFRKVPQEMEFLPQSDTYINLGYVSSKAKMRAIIADMEQHMKILLTVCAMDDPKLADQYLDLGMSYHQNTNHERAITMYTRAMKVYQRIAGEHVETLPLAKCYSMIGLAHRDKGDPNEALEWLEKAYTTMKELGGPMCPTLPEVLNARGAVYQELGAPGKAIEDYEEALLILYQLTDGNPNTPYIAIGYYNLGLAYAERAQNLLAKISLTRGIESAIEVFGEDHNTTMRMREALQLVMDRHKEEQQQQQQEAEGSSVSAADSQAADGGHGPAGSAAAA